ncbi:hypothetical protein EVA_13185 [gut metagenome]|uniref:Uncharacterized protein n=1 Tax=gut metagenome TaxID=749906 RepID=J9CFC8_9ZZZZ
MVGFLLEKGSLCTSFGIEHLSEKVNIPAGGSTGIVVPVDLIAVNACQPSLRGKIESRGVGPSGCV